MFDLRKFDKGSRWFQSVIWDCRRISSRCGWCCWLQNCWLEGEDWRLNCFQPGWKHQSACRQWISIVQFEYIRAEDGKGMRCKKLRLLVFFSVENFLHWGYNSYQWRAQSKLFTIYSLLPHWTCLCKWSLQLLECRVRALHFLYI